MKDTPWMRQTIGKYEIVSHLGSGGMGDIYKAVQKPLNRIVALKVLAPHLGRNEEFSARFEIEARAISLLEHNNIVSIYEYGEENGLKYFAMQYVDGYSLGQLLATRKSLEMDEVIEYTRQICRALRYAHSKSIVHRDIKPQNILIDKQNVCRLTDFGIAKIFSHSNITMTGVAVGTPEYMSPEQAAGEDLDAQTDIYSLGIVIYEMLTKRSPFTGNNPIAIAYKQIHEMPAPPSVLRKGIPKRLELIVLKALKKSRLERYRTIAELLDDLDTVDVSDISENGGSKAPSSKVVSNGASLDLSNRRITDRRSGDRRRFWSDGYPIFSVPYLMDTMQSQGLSLFLLLLLAAALVLHIIGKI
jgi:serine/threonine-protein kinase